MGEVLDESIRVSEHIQSQDEDIDLLQQLVLVVVLHLSSEVGRGHGDAAPLEVAQSAGRSGVTAEQHSEESSVYSSHIGWCCNSDPGELKTDI